MFEMILNNFEKVFIGGMMTALFGLLVATLKRFAGLSAAVLAMNHDQLFRYAEFYISTNQITMNELENLELIYKGYHALGGNGTGTELYERCKELPIIEHRTKFNPYYTERGNKNER